MRGSLVLFFALVFLAAGCALCGGRAPCPPPFSIYHAPSFDPNALQRVLLMPLANESPFPCAADDIRDALAAELQCIGPFEVVVAPITPETCHAKLVHLSGRFDEAAIAHLARTFKADAILVGAVTHFHPYPPPYIGLTVQLISPTSAVVIASVAGLWDGRDNHLAKEARVYYRKTNHPLLQPGQASEVGVTSPRLFQRLVCNQVAHALVEPEPILAATPSNPASPSPTTEAAHPSSPPADSKP